MLTPFLQEVNKMTVAGIIEQYNTERPNKVSDALKVGWLKKCEQMLINEVLIQHKHDLTDEKKVSLSVLGSTLKIGSPGSYEEHINGWDLDTELYVPEPYDDLYIHYLDQRIAYNNDDAKRYNKAVTEYNNALLAFQQYFNRTYITKKQPKGIFKHRWL